MSRPAAFFLLAAAGALLFWLLLDGGPTDRVRLAADAPEPARDALEPLTARAPVDDRATEPTLEGTHAPDDAPAARGDVRVRVLGTSGAPFPGAYVALRDAEGRLQRGRGLVTDAEGYAVLRDLPLDGSLLLAFYRHDPRQARGNVVWDELPPQGAGPARVPVTGTEVTWRARTGLPWTVEVVSAETGEALRGAQVLCRSELGAPTDERTWHEAPHTWMVAPHVGTGWVLGVTVAPLDGWVGWDRAWVTATVSPYARALRFVYPMRREVPVTVTAVGLEGEPLEPELHDVHVGPTRAPLFTWDHDAYRRLRIHGVPHLWGETLRLVVSRKDGRGRETLLAPIPDAAGARVDLDVVLGVAPASEEPAQPDAIGIGGGGKSVYRSSGPRGLENTLEIRVRRRDGTPATDAAVTVHRRTERTDASGLARFRRVAPGPTTVTVRQPGLLPLEGTVEIPSRGTATLTLQEGAGSEVEVLVLDPEGRPLPFATLTVKTASGIAWCDMDGAVQRIDPYTDHLGRRLLGHVEPGSLRVEARWGSRHGEATVEAAEGRQHTVRLVLQPAR